ncbi:hypothetical protein SGLAM104S_03687 [Streptomyces glaucescens]
MRRHWLDTLVVVLPLLRPVRLVKTYEAVQRRHGHPRLPLHLRVIVYAGLSVSLLGFAGALSVYHQEYTAPNATTRPSAMRCGGPAPRWRPWDTATSPP